MKKKLFLATIIVLLVLVACSSLEPATQSVPENESAQWTKLGGVPLANGLYRYVDSEAGVVCWLAERPKGAGLSCLPIEETSLR